ncbi:flagellar M-ring protein FliF C-terminal domain-containing protein [Actinoplanes derwentensis]|uniref:flagellar M-ring protein FliF C-terminal domain-containing protein n=1 Tax=Actinoplanes derwentensis TaxID=113562 RepID=UPI0015601381|nr:flagellar M-ring protein FliF C-terminal domain-containing protein [Actinoplanes derwentensis]GID87690.1 hypothetical protein Ade03nite_66140 [Actinoplanes derwentensis]
MKTPIAVVLAAVLAAGVCLHPQPVQAAGPEQTAAYEDRLNGALQKMLDAVVGPGHAVATTAVELDLDRVETVSRRYSRDPSVGALSETLSRTFYTDTSGTRYENTGIVRNNALNQLYETRTTAPGGVKKLSVAVLVDRAVDVTQLQKLVSAAAGADPARGDTVVVSVVTARPDVTAPLTSATTPAVTWQAGLVVLGLALLAVLLLMIRRRGDREDRTPVARIAPYQVEARPVVTAISAPTAPVRPSIDDPRRTAALLRGWTDPHR